MALAEKEYVARWFLKGVKSPVAVASLIIEINEGKHVIIDCQFPTGCRASCQLGIHRPDSCSVLEEWHGEAEAHALANGMQMVLFDKKHPLTSNHSQRRNKR